MDAQRQMIMRLRDVLCPRFVWLRSHSIMRENRFDRGFNLNDLLSSLIQEGNHFEDLQEVSGFLQDLSHKIESFPKAIMDLANNLKKIADYERIYFRPCFLEATQKEGYEVEKFTLHSDAAINAEYKAKSEEIKDQECREVFEASDKYLDVIAPVLPDSASIEDRRALEKAQILKTLPGIDREEIWSPDFIRFLRFDRFGILAQRRRLLLAQNLNIAQKLGHKYYSRLAQEAGFCPWELKQDYSEVRAIANSGILELIASGETFTADHPTVKAIIKTCDRAPIYKALGKKPGKEAIRYIGWLAGLLGFSISSKQIKAKANRDDRIYSINPDLENRSFLETIDKLLMAKLQAIATKKEGKNMIMFSGGADPSQTIAPQGLGHGTDTSHIFIKSRDYLSHDFEPSEAAQDPHKKLQISILIPWLYPQVLKWWTGSLLGRFASTSSRKAFDSASNGLSHPVSASSPIWRRVERDERL